MRTDRGNLMRMMIVSMSVLLACACAGLAQTNIPARVAKDIKIVSIVVEPGGGKVVGIADLASKTNYLLHVGETQGGIQVVDIDYEREAALLRKGTESYWMTMSGQVSPGNSRPLNAADPFVKGAKPRTVTAEATAGEVTTESLIEVMKRIIIPEIEFREASVQKVVETFQQTFADRDEKKRSLKILLDINGVASPPMAAPPTKITFSARYMNLFQALTLAMGITGLELGQAFTLPDGNYVLKIVPKEIVADSAPDPFADAHPGASLPNLEIEVQFVAFDMTNVEKLVASGGLNVDSLTKLWIGGAGHLLAAPRVVTPAGQEATVKGVTEYIYPTAFTVTTGEKVGDTTSGETTGTNTSAAATKNTAVASGGIVEPGGFETRDVGAILTVLPEVREDGTITLTLTPQLVEEPVWHDYGSKYLDSNGKEQQVRREQPFFESYGLQTSVTVSNGQRMLIGGGTLSRGRKQMVFMFVTARKVGIRGETIK